MDTFGKRLLSVDEYSFPELSDELLLQQIPVIYGKEL
jgi:hypothetical protein